ncbi:MAG: hypothetical protein RMI45_02865 [Ignisphaera sp.]|nr:hypothetical protein [Ignisphaera sp.]MDW8085166.1 hypothetical protein [Ignisphaera sp.]
MARDGVKVVCIATSLYNMPWQSHVLALLTSYNAFSGGVNIARKMEIEYMVRLFSERQISTIVSGISENLSDDRYIVVLQLHSQYEECGEELNVSRITDVIGGVIEDYSCRFIDWSELLKKPTLHAVNALTIFRRSRNIDTKGLEENLNEILIGVSGCNSILIE